MKICPTCGDVYSERATECRAHGAVLHPWNEPTGVGQTAHTDDDTRSADDHTAVEVIALTSDSLVRGMTPTPPPVADPTPQAQPSGGGRVLGGRYRLESQIGIGGYGAVFAAFDESQKQRVAVKILSPALSHDAAVLERFRREAVAATMVHHEGIVQVLDFDCDPSGLYYITMEYLDGIDLNEALNTRPAPDPVRSLDIALQCAKALSAAHIAGILHRDLKPANIFLTHGDGRENFVKIIDFGISKITRQVALGADLTSASKVLGTPAFMSPEQARGETLDGRADVYALGVILFMMLTGIQPFTGASALEILENHAHQKRVRPSKVNPALKALPTIDAVVLKALAIKSEDRYESMAAFADAIAGCLDAANGITPTSPVHVLPPELETTVAVSPLPVPAAARVPAPSGEVTRLSRNAPRPRRKAIYALVPLALMVMGGGAWFALSNGKSAAATETQESIAPAPAPIAPVDRVQAPDAAVEIEVAKAAEPPPPAPPPVAATPVAKPDEKPAPTPKRKPRRSKRPREKEEPLGIQEW